jgi:NLI interacting factor-like phosphatase
MFRWSYAETAIPAQAMVLDLDESIISSCVDGTPFPQELFQNPEVAAAYYTVSTREGEYWGVKRPHVDEFLAYCFQRFQGVGFWSAGKEGYVNEIVKALAPPGVPTFVRARHQCDQLHTEYKMEDGKIQLVPTLWKPLQLLFDVYPQFTRYNTWVVDDRQEYAQENLLNWLAIPPFSPEPTVAGLSDRSDDYLLRLMEWLERPEVKNSGNVLEVEKDWY